MENYIPAGINAASASHEPVMDFLIPPFKDIFPHTRGQRRNAKDFSESFLSVTLCEREEMNYLSAQQKKRNL